MKLSEACKEFLNHCKSVVNLSPHTIKAYGYDFAEIQQYFGARRPLSSLERHHLREYILHLREVKKFKETTIKRRLASFKLLLKWVKREGLTQSNPFESLDERIRLPRRLPRALDRSDQAILQKAISLAPTTKDFDEILNKTAIHLLLGTGIRVGELAAIKLKDLSLANKCILIHGKGNRQRLVYLLQQSLYKKIERYLSRRRSVTTCAETLFISSSGRAIRPPSVRTALKEISQLAGTSRHVTPHMLRHTCATRWLETGLDIRYVQKLLGHHSISTTEIYTHVSDQGLREALARAGGKR